MIYWISGVISAFVIVIIWYLRRSWQQPAQDYADHMGYDKLAAPEEKHIDCPLVYNGSELHFPDKVLDEVLTRHFNFYNHLLDIDKERFLSRLKKFITTKVFVIHDRKGYREMPILISASAVQLTFGLKKYLLSHFHIIQIFPEAFVGLEPFRILIGNVTGNTINIAWKQFLEGYRNKYDMQNVGLHEMAHALYYQNFETSLYVDKDFRESFHKFNSIGDKIYHVEKILTIGLYSEYAIKDFQEFWAESIEIYFKSPDRLQLHYPELYSALCEILNQDLLNYPHHLFSQE